MNIKININQVVRFIYTAVLMELGVYFITGLICKSRFSFTMIHFCHGLSYAGLVILAVAGIIFITARPRPRRPGEHSDESPGKRSRNLGSAIFSSLRPFTGSLGMTTDHDPSESPGQEKLTSKQLYYLSGLFFLVGLMTILSSEIIYRGLLERVNLS